MSYELVQVSPSTSGDEATEDRKRDLWPDGQIFFRGNDEKTTQMWDKWSEEDAYPLITKIKYILKPEFATDGFQGGHFEISNPYSYVKNAYVRGGLAWTATYYYAFKQWLAPDVPFEDELYATSDFDTVACTANLVNVKDFDVDMDTRLSYVDKNGNRYWSSDCQGGKNPEKGGWPYEYSKFLKKNMPIGANDILNIEAMNTRMLGINHEGRYMSWTRLASFFQDKLRIGKHPFITNEVDKEVKDMELKDIWVVGENEDLQDKYFVDFPDDRHENNVNVYPSRYGLADDVPYLMRVEGFGFVETPTVQIGQILDSLSDYKRCATYPGIGIKAKYARRLARIEHAFRVHESVKKKGYTEQTSPFVLSDAVVKQYELYRANGAFSAFKEATNPEKDNCRKVDVDEKNRKVIVYGGDLRCDDQSDVHMNCAAMMKEHPFKEKGRTKMYDKYSAWMVESINKRKIEES